MTNKNTPVNTPHTADATHTTVENETFISRWSRRKQQVALEEAPPDLGLEVPATMETQANIHELSTEQTDSTEQERLDALNTLTDEDMPNLDTLDESSDYSGFMSSNVSEALRKVALRKLFASDTFNVRDGLDEYDGDYTQFEKLDPSTITSDMKHMLEVEAERLKAEESLKENLTPDSLDEQQEISQKQEVQETQLVDSDDNEIHETSHVDPEKSTLGVKDGELTNEVINQSISKTEMSGANTVAMHIVQNDLIKEEGT